MESEKSPGIIYTIREFKLEESNGDQKLIREHIFVGDFLDSGSIKDLNSGRKDPSHKDLRGFFKNVEFDRSKAIQKYYPSLIEFSDTINDLYFKIRENTKVDRFYLWHSEMKNTLTHQFKYRNKFLKLNSDPFKRQANLDRIFTAYGNLSFIDQTKHLIREYLVESQKVINMISEKILIQIAKQYSDQVETKVIINRFMPPELDRFPESPYYQINETQCLNTLLRDANLPLSLMTNEKSGEAGTGSRGDAEMVEIDYSQIEQCTIHVKTTSADEAFINLETIFQLVPMDEIYIFTKMKRGDRSISKVSRKVQKFKNQVTKELLAEWANIEEHHRGLMYRKLKNSLGLVIYRIYENGFIELQINWTDKIKFKEQLEEIKNEIDLLNKFIARLNLLNYQLPDHEGELIQEADSNFMNDPNSLTQFMYFNFKTFIDTNKQQISWNAFNYLAGSFPYYFSPIFNWRVYNFNELRRMTSGVTESNIFYLRTAENMVPDLLTAVIYSLGLIGNIDKEQTVTVDRQKELIIEFQKQIYPDSTNMNLDLPTLDNRITELKRGNPGVLLNLKASGDRYLLNVKGAHNLPEIYEINFLVERLMKFYFHIGAVYKYIKNYNCSSLYWILSMQEKYDSEKQKKSKKLAATIQIQQEEEEVEDIFNVGDMMDDSEIVIPDIPSAGDDFEQVGEIMIPKDLRDLADVDEVKKEGKKVMSALDYLKDISAIFRTEYRRLGCTENFPAVISIKDFWANYTRLSKRFQYIKSSMKKKDQEEYQKKFQKELDSGDQNLELHRKRVSWVAKKLDGLNKTLVTEIADIFDRYNKGAQMKVPLDKDKTKYSGEYFYFCPRKWCYFCRESRLSDEIVMVKKNATCKICANELYSMKGTKNTFIGFPDSKRHNHLNCLPCCFKNETKFKKKIDVCRVSHPMKTIARPTKKGVTDVGHILTGDNIGINRIGYLDGVQEGKLNDLFNDGMEFDKVRNNQSIYVLRGVNNVGPKNAFLEALSHIKLMGDEKLTSEQLRQNIVDKIDPLIFMTLNNGLIYTIFKTKDNTDQEALDEFKLYLSTEYLNEDILWHLTSFPGIFTAEGYNLLIISRSLGQNNKDHKYTMLCPVGLSIDEYFNPNKLTAVFLKLENNNVYYPISLVSCSIDFKDIQICTRSIQDYILFDSIKNPVINKLLNHVRQNCEIKPNPFEKNRFDLYQTIKELDRTSFLDREKLHLIVNFYNQVIFIKLKNENGRFILFPVKSTPMPIDTVSEIYEDFEKISIYVYEPPTNKELVTYKEAISMIKILTKRTKIPLKLKYFVVNFQDLVYGLKLENGLTVIFQEVPLKMFKPKDQLPIIEEESNDVDISINQFEQKIMDQRQSYVNQTTFQKESYQRLRFEISKIIPKRKELRDQIIEILKKPDELDNKRQKIEKIIFKLIDELAILKKPNLSSYKLPQIRSQCTTHDSCDDPHCFRDGKICKVLLPEELILPNDTTENNTIDRYVVLISDEILRNVIKGTELLDGKVSIYVNPSQMVYNVKSEMMINDPDYEIQINDLYARSVDYLDLLRKNYFLQESEVFTREVEQFLYYFPEESWYKNTGLSKNDFVMNNRNIYDLLNEILGVDIGEQMWDFVEKHNWKLWLNALYQIKGDEYQNIFQYSQFMEHFKYGKSTLTNVHLALISRLNNIKIIIMNRNAIGNRKFQCLGTTQASSSSKNYIILYQYDQDGLYLVGRTPHLDLTKSDDVTYIFKENKIPIKFFKMWYDHCPEDRQSQKKPDPYDILIKNIPKSPDYDSFSYDDREEDDRQNIKMEQIIEAPGKVDTIKRPEFLDDLDESLIGKRSPSRSKSRSPSRSPSRSKSRSPNRGRSPSRSKSRSPSRSPSRSKSRSPDRSRSPSRSKSRKKISPPRKLTMKKRAPPQPKKSPLKKITMKRAPQTKKKEISPPRKLTMKNRSTSITRAKPKLTFKKRGSRSRSVSRKKTRSRSVSRKRGRSRSTSRKKPARLTFKKRK